MKLSYESVARTLEKNEVESIRFDEVHPHSPAKIIPFTAPAVHPSMASRHRRMAHRREVQGKLFVTYPRYLCVGAFALAFFCYLAMMPTVLTASLCASAFALAGISHVAAQSLEFDEP